MDITFASELKLVYTLHYKKIVLHQRFLPDAFQNCCNRLTYSSALETVCIEHSIPKPLV